jgi:hypothetical protein
MSTLLVPWIAFPLVLLALSLGCGLVVERAAGGHLPGVLVVPVGLAGLVVVSLFATTTGATAQLATPAVAAVAALGFVLAAGRSRGALDRWAAAAALGAFLAYAAPVVLSGESTFPGYVKLDDDATFLANLDRAMEHGRSLDGLEPSSYLATLEPHLAKGYPLGAVMPVGVGRELVGGDTLWLYHPAVAFTAAMLALALYRLVSSAVPQRWLCGLAAFVGAQSALLYGYALWGGLKEVAGAAAIALCAALVWPAVQPSPTPRAFVPLAVSFAWLLGVLSSGAVVWLLPATGVAVAMILVAQGRRGWPALAAFAGLVVLLAIPTLVAAPSFLTNRIFEFDYLANLASPLEPDRLAGVWLMGDFRFEPDRKALTYVLIAVVVAAAVGGVAWALRRRRWALPAYAIGTVASCLVFFPFVTPWIEGKALAMAAPAVPLAAMVACSPLVLSGRRVECGVLAGMIAAGVLWSNTLQYHEAWLAPYGQLHELEEIGERYAGEGPALMTEFQPYGVRHLLRELDAEGASELRIRPIPLRSGQLLEKGATANIDEFDQSALRVYRTLVLRRSPLESRPPSDYRLVESGRWYDVWQRDDAAARVLEHVPLGDGGQPAAEADCSEIERLARVAGPDGRIAAAERHPAIVAPVTGVDETVPIDVTLGGGYEVWLGGSVKGSVDVWVDGRKLTTLRHRLDHPGHLTPLGFVELAPGRHELGFDFSRRGVRPGEGGIGFPAGPVALSVTGSDVPVTTVSSQDARSLCDRQLDWVEALEG